MGKILNTYGGFTASTIIARASNTCTYSNLSTSVDCTDITTTKIKNVISGTSNSVAALCSSANVNIWSNFSPREFVPSGNTLVSVVKTPYSMGNFAGYNHNAVLPTPPAATFTYNKGSGSVNTSVAIKIKIGEYDYTKLGATKAKVIVYDTNGTTIYAESTAMDFTSSAGEFITFSNVPFSINISSTYVQDYTTYIMLCNSAGDDLYYIPVSGTVHIEVVAVVANKISVNVSGNVKTFTMVGDGLYNGSMIYQNGTYSGIGTADNKTLSSITYNIYNSSTNALVSGNTYTSFNSNEYPTRLDFYSVGDPETFYADFSGARPTPTAGQYLRVIMNYV